MFRESILVIIGCTAQREEGEVQCGIARAWKGVTWSSQHEVRRGVTRGLPSCNHAAHTGPRCLKAPPRSCDRKQRWNKCLLGRGRSVSRYELTTDGSRPHRHGAKRQHTIKARCSKSTHHTSILWKPSNDTAVRYYTDFIGHNGYTGIMRIYSI